jgi:hypothetical protein
MKQGRFVKFEYDMKEIHESRCDPQIWMKGSKWAEVREADFKKKLRKFKSSHITPKQWADELAVKIKQSHNPDSIDLEYESRIGHLLA